MILPSTQLLSMILLALSVLCWGFWTSTFKMAGPKWRFELYYFDFAVGLMLCALLAGFTFGSMGWDGFSLLDDLRNAGKRQDLFAFLAGCVFNLANMLLMATVSVAGMSAAFPIVFGVAIPVGILWNTVLSGGGNSPLLAGASVCALVATGVAAMAHKSSAVNKIVKLAEAGKTKTTKKTVSSKGILIGAMGGLMMGSSYPLIDMARAMEIGLGPFALMVVFGAGVLFSSFVYNLFFMNLPVQGKPVDFSEYFKGSPKAHLMGVLGGILWAAGAILNLVLVRSEGAAQMGPAFTQAVGQGAGLLAMLLGLVYWKEYSGSDSKVRTLLSTTLVLFGAAIAMASVSGLAAAAR